MSRRLLARDATLGLGPVAVVGHSMGSGVAQRARSWIVYPGAGHSFHWEEPDRFAADLIAFLEGLR